jgi:hypothetical protein
MKIGDEFPQSARDLLLVRGKDLLDTLGLPALRSVVTQVLCGVNIRDATETLTHRRISLLNAALLNAYSNMAQGGLSANEIADEAFAEIRKSTTSLEDKIVLRWMLGLTQKQVQNVLRSDDTAWRRYVEKLKENNEAAAKTALEEHGPFPLAAAGQNLDWGWGLAMLTAVGSQTLGTRGSEKSLYGKFFEKLIMGSVLSVLGFKLSDEQNISSKSFMLSSTSKRESDATAIWEIGQGVRFDIGFIGRGNPEITLDKVSRFERDYEINGKKTQLKTIIIVDVVGKNSSIKKLAADIDGVIIQMSYSDWVFTLGEELENALEGYVSPFKSSSHSDYVKFIQEGVAKAPLESIFRIAALPEEPEEEPAEEDEDE